MVLLAQLDKLISYYFPKYLCRQTTQFTICKYTTSSRRSIESTSISSTRKRKHTTPVHSQIELDSHADTIVAGSNCVVLQYTGDECDVSPFQKDYDDIKDVKIATVATAWQSPHSGQIYILVFHQALWMGELMDHTLVNPNQLRYYGTHVQDNPMSHEPLSLMTEDEQFCMEMQMNGTIVSAHTFSPSDEELESCPHIVLSSPHSWNPHTVKFPKVSMSMHEYRGGSLNVSSIAGHYTTQCEDEEIDAPEDTIIFDFNRICRRICGMSRGGTTLSKPSIDVGTSDLPETHTFTSNERRTDVSPQALSERWNISLSTAIKTLKKTTQKFLCSGILPLSRRYRMDRVFQRKTLAGVWSTDTMDGRSVSLDGNRYAQVFTNKNYFARIYPMDSKGKAGDALRLFCQEFGVPEKLTMDGSKEQTGKHTEFMKQVRKHDIDYHIIEPDSPNQNPCEHTIGELRRKWFRLMIRKRIPEKLWDYGFCWVAETMSMTFSSAGNLTGCIPMAEVTGEGVDISEYLDFGFYDEVWFKDNAGLSSPKPGRWLGVASRIGKLMTYHILQDNGKILSRSTVQRVTNLEKKTTEVQSIFTEFDKSIHTHLKCKDRRYDGCKPNPEDWADLIEADEDFRDEFRKVFNAKNIPESDDLPQDETEDHDTYVEMELALNRDDDGPAMAKIKKRMRDADGIPIGTANDNPLLDSRLYEVEHMDGLISHITANTIAENLFSQVDDEGNRHVLLDSIIDARTDGSELTANDAFILSPNGGKRRRKTTKGWEILIQWKDGSSTWESMKDVKDCYPVQLAEYAQENNLSQKPAFAWWIPQVLKKKKRIISKIQSKYWLKTHKFGIEIPKSVKHACKVMYLRRR